MNVRKSLYCINFFWFWEVCECNFQLYCILGIEDRQTSKEPLICESGKKWIFNFLSFLLLTYVRTTGQQKPIYCRHFRDKWLKKYDDSWFRDNFLETDMTSGNFHFFSIKVHKILKAVTVVNLFALQHQKKYFIY